MSFQHSENQYRGYLRDAQKNQPSAVNTPHDDMIFIQEWEALSTIEKLPVEIIDHILGYMSPKELAFVSMTCRVLARHAASDRLWRNLVNLHLPKPISNPGIFLSFRSLYYAHLSLWFIPQHKIWIGDTRHTGSLVLALYDNRRGVIEGYRVIAERGNRTFEAWQSNPDVMIPSFNPQVSLWLDQSAISLRPQPICESTALSFGTPSAAIMNLGWTWKTDFVMPALDFGYLELRLCRKEDTSFEDYEGTRARAWEKSVWPPLTIPSENRSYRTECKQRARPPENLSEISENTFRILRGRSRNPLVQQPWDERTYATLDASLYTPTKEKPYQGIWVGDYSAHGCEFLLFFQRAPEGPAETQDAEQTDNGAESVVHRGSLTAVKLTGDPNVPRGERSFWADDIGPDGFLRLEPNEPFRNARVVKSSGQVAGLGFRDGMLSSLLTIPP